MDPLYAELKEDLDRLKLLVELIESVKLIASVEPQTINNEDSFFSTAFKIKEQSIACHSHFVILSGTIVLYLGGRFEFFIKCIFEDLCDRVAVNCKKFEHFPREMRDNLIKLTAEVMSNPRKYGHADQGVKSFIKIMAQNLNDEEEIKQINSKCLSITYENMRADTIEDLFNRIGFKGIWKRLSQQARLIAFHQCQDGNETENITKAYLNSFMNSRNSIAHPTVGVEWPDSSKVKDYISFFEALCFSLSELIPVIEQGLTRRSTT